MTHTLAVLKRELAPFTNLFSSRSFLPIVTNTNSKWQLQAPISMTSGSTWASSPIFLSLLLLSPSGTPCLYRDLCRRHLTHFLTPSTSLHSAPRTLPHASFALHILFVISPCAALSLHISLCLEQFCKWVLDQYPLHFKHSPENSSLSVSL